MSLKRNFLGRNAVHLVKPELIETSGHVRPRQGTEICNFGAPSPLDFFGIFSHGYVSHFSMFSVQFSKDIAQKVENIARFPGEEKNAESCHGPEIPHFVRTECWHTQFVFPAGPYCSVANAPFLEPRKNKRIRVVIRGWKKCLSGGINTLKTTPIPNGIKVGFVLRMP